MNDLSKMKIWETIVTDKSVITRTPTGYEIRPKTKAETK